jgi:hypothetical protein
VKDEGSPSKKFHNWKSINYKDGEGEGYFSNSLGRRYVNPLS